MYAQALAMRSLDADGAAALAAAQLPRLQCLRIGCVIGDLTVLLPSSWLSRLRALEVNNADEVRFADKVAPTNLGALVGAGMSALEILSLTTEGCEAAAAIAAQVAGMALPRLRALSLASSLDDAAVAAIVHAPWASRLQQLRICGDVHEAGAASLASAPLGALRTLGLALTTVGPTAAMSLMRAPWWSGLVSLEIYLPCYGCSPPAWHLLAGAPLGALRRLQLVVKYFEYDQARSGLEGAAWRPQCTSFEVVTDYGSLPPTLEGRLNFDLE
jgi:hypothetical protein